MDKIQINRSVRDFVVPLEPCGSLDASLSLQLEEDAVAQGARVHRKIQRRLAKEYPGMMSEHSLHWIEKKESFECIVRGRVDAIIIGDATIVEEIKSTFRPQTLLKTLEEKSEHPFSQQVRMYAWMYVRSQSGNSEAVPSCRIRVVSLLDEVETIVEIAFDYDVFTQWVDTQIEGLHQQQMRAIKRAEERKHIGEQLCFPFDTLRQGQQHMQNLVTKTLDTATPLMVQAPTGLGKTAAVLFSALKNALVENLRVFYLTPRNSQHTVAENTISLFIALGYPVRSVTIRAKERICPQKEIHCHPDFCPRANGYYDRLKSSRSLEYLANTGCADSGTIQKIADENMLCPFELSLDAACNADVIIGDYNYALAPTATLARFFGDEYSHRQNILLIDEAHNLPSRASAWFSPSLDKSHLAALKNICGSKTHGYKTKFLQQLSRCTKLIGSFRGAGRRVEDLDPNLFYSEEQRIRELIAKAAQEGLEPTPNNPLVQLYRHWLDFCDILRDRTDAHLITWNPPGRLQITCVDASKYLAERFTLLRGLILFSATLKPFDYYQRLSGLCNCMQEEIPSPFPAENRYVLIVPQISTLFRNREQQIPRIANFISRVIPQKHGNYLIFFPSFDFLEKTMPLLDLPGFEIMAQPRRASTEKLSQILDSLTQRRGLVVLAVQGGSLSEGIDLPGNALIGCTVVGPPIPPFDIERRLTKEYFARLPLDDDIKQIDAEAYTYIYPAMAKAIQAAGRVIRGPEERGLLVFLDNRFLLPEYAACFPKDWFESPKDAVSGSILEDVRRFWNKCI